jgi:hypothetical protein
MVELWVAQALEGKIPQGLKNHKIAQELGLKWNKCDWFLLTSCECIQNSQDGFFWLAHWDKFSDISNLESPCALNFPTYLGYESMDFVPARNMMWMWGWWGTIWGTPCRLWEQLEEHLAQHMRLNQGHRSRKIGNWWEQQREPDEACYLIDPFELMVNWTVLDFYPPKKSFQFFLGYSGSRTGPGFTSSSRNRSGFRTNLEPKPDQFQFGVY